MDLKHVGIKVLKGAIYGAIGTISGLQFAGITDYRMFGKALLGAAISGALHGAHDALKQLKG